MRVGAKALTDRYSANDLAIVELLRRSLEDFNVSVSDLVRLVTFYLGDVQFEMLDKNGTIGSPDVQKLELNQLSRFCGQKSLNI